MKQIIGIILVVAFGSVLLVSNINSTEATQRKELTKEPTEELAEKITEVLNPESRQDQQELTEGENHNILEASEYQSVEEFIASAKEIIKSPSPDPYATKVMQEIDTARWVITYSNHFAALSNNQEEIEKLNNIKDIATELYNPPQPIEQKENHNTFVTQLQIALDRF